MIAEGLFRWNEVRKYVKLRVGATEFDSQFSTEEAETNVRKRIRRLKGHLTPARRFQALGNPVQSLRALVALLSVAGEKNGRLDDSSKSSLQH